MPEYPRPDRLPERQWHQVRRKLVKRAAEVDAPYHYSRHTHLLYKIFEQGMSVEEALQRIEESSEEEPRPDPSPRRMPVSHFLYAPLGHMCLTPAYPRPRMHQRIQTYFEAGFDAIDLCIGINKEDNPYQEAHWRIDVRKASHADAIIRALNDVQSVGKTAIGWTRLDDERPGLSEAEGHEVIEAMESADILSHPALTHIIAFLEANETVDSDELREYGMHLRGATPHRTTVGCHWGSGRWSPHDPGKEDGVDDRRVAWWRRNTWCKVLHFQIPHDDIPPGARHNGSVHKGFLSTDDQIRDWLPFLVQKLTPVGVKVWAAEYAFNTSPGAAERAGRLIDGIPGIVGRQNG